jgi:hypothetical protein
MKGKLTDMINNLGDEGSTQLIQLCPEIFCQTRSSEQNVAIRLPEVS